MAVLLHVLLDEGAILLLFSFQLFVNLLLVEQRLILNDQNQITEHITLVVRLMLSSGSCRRSYSLWVEIIPLQLMQPFIVQTMTQYASAANFDLDRFVCVFVDLETELGCECERKHFIFALQTTNL